MNKRYLLIISKLSMRAYLCSDVCVTTGTRQSCLWRHARRWRHTGSSSAR